MADRNLVKAIVASGLSQDGAEHMADVVLAALVECMAAGKGVMIPGIGRLRVVKKPKRIMVGPDRGKAQEISKVNLQHPAIVSTGPAY